jgi:hypothetical protein
MAIVHGLERKDFARTLQHPAVALGVRPRTLAKPPASGKTKRPQRIEPTYGERKTLPSFGVGLRMNETHAISDQRAERLDGEPASGCQVVVNQLVLSGRTEKVTSRAVRGAFFGPLGTNGVPE